MLSEPVGSAHFIGADVILSEPGFVQYREPHLCQIEGSVEQCTEEQCADQVVHEE